MKKNLRLLCLGLFAATFTFGYAQEDKTSLLKNADMELGSKGWVFDGKQILGKNTKNLNTDASKIGFHGMNQGVLEAWNANSANPLGDSYIMQRLKELPSGTYVFGAYVGAAKQNNRRVVNKQEIAWSNRDSINGVVLFANDSVVRVATDNPDMAYYNHKFAHSSKFNVAVTLTDTDKKKGYLDVGLRVINTNANYVVFDNATLYYFGEMSEAAALDEMAKIDMANAAAVADTLVTLKMNVDSLDALNDAIAIAKKGESTAATLWDDSEDFFYAVGHARRSIADYKLLKAAIEHAQRVSEGVWTADYKDFYFEGLTYAINDAKDAYENADRNREELEELRIELYKNAGFMRLDSVNIAKSVLEEFIRTGAFTNATGEYTTDQKKQLEALLKEVNDTLGVVEAFDAENPRPQDVYPYIKRIYDEIDEVKNNPHDGAWMQVLLQSSEAVNGYRPVTGTVWADSIKNFVYTSPLITPEDPAEVVRLTITTAANNNQIYFCISSLEFYDKDGNEIALKASDFTSNADHNSVAGFNDGQSFEGLVDDKLDTYFHSDWSGTITDPHYLEVTFPEGAYDAFSFKMVSRAEGQRHQFPGEIIVTTSVPKHGLNNVKNALADAQALLPYAGKGPGFYQGDFSKLIAAMSEAEAVIEEYTSEEDCDRITANLRAEIEAFNAIENKVYNMPEAGKTYRFVSAGPYLDKQGLEKALTIRGDSAFYWENVCVDSLMQEFVLEEILNEDDELVIETQEIKDADGNVTSIIPIYCYKLKSKKSGLYVEVDSLAQSTHVKLNLVESTNDTVRLKHLGAGQWNIIAKGGDPNNNQLHTGQHSNGAGVQGTIVAWNGELNSSSAWFIREMPEMPLEVLVETADFKSDFIHFAGVPAFTLTADKECAFDGLTLYDLYGNVIAIDSLDVTGKTATITQAENLVGCAFAFNNAEGVTSVVLDASIPKVQLLQKAYDEAVAVEPEAGDQVAQYSDLSAYDAAIGAAEKLLEEGGSDEAMVTAIDELDKAVKGLKPNMPSADKVYVINSAVNFEEKKGYKMVLASYGTYNIRWKNENYLDLHQYWKFEQASVAQLKEAGMDSTACAFFIKSLGTEKYLSEVTNTDGVTTALVDTISEAMPFVLTILNSGTEVALDGLGQSGKRIHANNHGSGNGSGSNIVYYGSGAGSASAWHIVDAGTTYLDADLEINNVDIIEIEAPVIKGIYDLFGRRLENPSAPGIYIIDGVKRVIK